MQQARFQTAKRFLLFWALFIGIGAVAGALGMLLDPTGRAMRMDAMLPYFQKLPFAEVLFRDYTFSGWALLGVNGIPNLIAAVLLLKNKRIGAYLGGLFGVTLMLWICIQFYMFPPNGMSIAYFLFGFCQAAIGWAACVFQRQADFSVCADAYPNIGADPTRLVVYFSRMGYVKRVALAAASATGADLWEIKATEKTGGTAGFWWCGRFGLLRADMPIEPISVDLSAYREMTVCGPIWAFSLASPVRSFLRAARGRIRHVHYIFVHHTGGCPAWHNAGKLHQHSLPHREI